MSKATTYRAFRVSEIPEAWSQQNLKTALEQHGVTGVFSGYKLLPSPLTPGTCTAILLLDPAVPVLKPLQENPLSDCLLPSSESNLVVDQHFLGLTVVASPPSTKIEAEYAYQPALAQDTCSLTCSVSLLYMALVATRLAHGFIPMTRAKVLSCG